MITPTAGLNPDKGLILSQFMHYFACTGQQKASVLGYAPLPPNLVQVVFDAIQAIPGKDPAIPVTASASNCDNPTFSGSLGSGSTNSLKGSKTTTTTTDTASPSATDPATSTDTTSGSTSTGGSTYTASQPVTIAPLKTGSSIPAAAWILLAALLGPPVLVTGAKAATPPLRRFGKFVRVAVFGQPRRSRKL